MFSMTSEPPMAWMGRRTQKSRWVTVIASIALLALLAIPVVVVFGGSPSSQDDTSLGHEGAGLRSTLEAPAPEEDLAGWSPEGGMGEFVQYSTGSQVTYVRLADGFHAGTATERFARPALSLIKLYIADYVLEHGTLKEQFEAIAMISSSDDTSAEELHQKYPEAIEETAEKYGLLSTRSHERWGYSVTSTYDAVTFIAALLDEDPTHPILVAMAGSDEVAADGYEQDFGTAVLPGVIGTKWGWSDDRQLHSSVSFGTDFVVAAAVTGSAKELTRLVEHQLDELPGPA